MLYVTRLIVIKRYCNIFRTFKLSNLDFRNFILTENVMSINKYYETSVLNTEYNGHENKQKNFITKHFFY